MSDFARMDNMLSASQTDIGESSNLAQIAQSYACNFNDPKYQAYVCILSVAAQIAIDSAKRRFDIDVTSEIKRIKDDMDIYPEYEIEIVGKKYKKTKKIEVKKGNLYPAFWGNIKKGFNKKLINKELHCPMNYLCEIKFDRMPNTNTIPMNYFFKKFADIPNRKTCRKVEELITKFSLKVKDSNELEYNEENNLLLRADFDDLVKSIRSMNISGKYVGLFSWLLDRCFMITPGTIRNSNTIKSKMNKNMPILIKVLYEVNSANLLKCFSNNCE